MMLYLTTIQNQYEEVYGSEIWQQTPDGISLESKIKDMVLAKIAQVKVMNLMAESYGITLNEDDEKQVRKKAVDFYAGLNETERTLIGVTEEDVISIYSEYVLAEKLYDYVIRDINPEISDDEARTVTVMRILIKTYTTDAEGKTTQLSERAKIEAYEKAKLVAELAKTEDTSFESLAAKYSDDETLTYSLGRGEASPEIEEVVFNLGTGEVSGVVETEAGYHILKCVSSFDVDETQANKSVILKERKDAVFNETYDTFLTTLTKTLNEKLYDSISLIHDPEVTTSEFFNVDF